MVKLFFQVIFCFFLLSSVFAEEPYTLDKIVVRPSREDASASSLNKNYAVETFSRDEIKNKGLNSLADLLDYASGMDLRSRGPFGIQGDISLRGSTYEQVAVLIDGQRVIDPQTGHHNLDIPLTVFDVDRVEIMKEGVSSLYGSGALAGSVNIITRKPLKKEGHLETLFGEHALFGQGFSLSLPQRDFSGRVSMEHKISNGGRPNTDFEYGTTSLYVAKEAERYSYDTLFGYQKKDFGADSFYSNLFPEEEEHTETFFFRTGLESRSDSAILKNNLFLRRHRDKFILRRNNPTSVNYHTTYVYGIDSNLSLPTEYGMILAGLDTGRDEINSTNLGKHTRIHEGASVGFMPKLGEKLSADLRLRLDRYQRWAWQRSYNAGLAYDLIADKLKIKGSLGSAFRIPSFTDLYYSDAANKGNPDLWIEKSDSYRLGLDFQGKKAGFSLDGFLRRGHNLIDWTRASTADPWQVTNLGRVDFKGVEFVSRIRPGINYKGLDLEEVNFSYTYTDADKKQSGFLSKYALDILKHQLALGLEHGLFGLSFSWRLSYQERYYGETYFIGNLYVAKKINCGNAIWEPFLKIDNFSNTKYTEVGGVVEPGRWIKTGLKLEW